MTRASISFARAARLLPVLVAFLAAAETRGIPRVPFSGVYGATAGAGSLTGWDRLGGENPAALVASGAPGWVASAAGYAPFGLDGLRATEVEVARDAPRWGASFAWRALSGENAAAASMLRARVAARLARGASGFLAGGSLRLDIAPEAAGGVGPEDVSFGLGALWRPWPFATLGAAWEDGVPGVGLDGGALWKGVAWRMSAERVFGDAPESRFGLGLRLHPLLSVSAGWAPARETASLGVRFGAGAWEGFSAVRRHARLGGTSIQGVRWTRARDGGGKDGAEKSRASFPSER
jgi:hypothetical protein